MLGASVQQSLNRAIAKLRHAIAKRDAALAVQLLESTLAAGLNPRLAIEKSNDQERALLREWFELWDDALRGWWLRPGTQGESLSRQLLLPTESGFPLPLLIMNAWWLRESGSERVNHPGAPPSSATGKGKKKLIRQGQALGRFCLTCDASTPLDYGAVAKRLHPKLRPFFAHWFLSVYLLSPLTGLDENVNRNRRRAIQSFSAFHDEYAVETPFSPLHGTTAYRACYLAQKLQDDVAPFIGTLANRQLAPALARRGANFSEPPLAPSDRIGVYLSCWVDGHAVQRCIDPLLDQLRIRGVTAYFDGDPQAVLRSLPEHWRQGNVELVALGRCATSEEIIAAAERIRADQLDFLFYPEIGLTTATRSLSTLRLARVQAVGYGHPITSGSDAIDFFVGGQAVEPNSDTYREQLALLPGLGVSSTEPPTPSGPRRRPLTGDDIAVVNMSSFDKLNPTLVGAWNRILEAAGPDASLHLFPAIPEDRLAPLVARLGPLLSSGEAFVSGAVPRQQCIDLLNDADVYLDSFPFGGYNTVVEALVCGCPVVTLETEHAVGRFGAALLRALELPSFLIAQTVDEYCDAASRLVADAELRLEVRGQLSRQRVLETLARQTTSEHFSNAVQWMRQSGSAVDAITLAS